MKEDDFFNKYPEDGYEALGLIKTLMREGLSWTVLLDAMILCIQQDPTAPVWLAQQLEKVVDQMEVDAT